ncbi:MAG TPA: DNA polymerase III subunit gamma/tau [Flavobacteriales bacterium]
MEKFIVSARKYRPALFDTVVGQEAVTGTLKNAIRNNHLASAFLFTGPRGVGKTTCARILARTINCENLGADLVPCGKCAPCITFEEGHSLNIFELDAASNNSVDDIRNLILQVQIAPQVGSKKVYIIDEVHMLSAAAFNAFLKTLEEPPSYAIFILATTEKHKILPTILSRCQVFDFRRITVGDIAKHLADIARKEDIEAEPQALHTIAQKADGGLRDALSIFDQLVSFAGHRLTYQDVVKNLNVLDHEHYFSLTEQLLKGDTAGALVEFNSIILQGFDGHLFITGLAKHFRDLLVSQDPRTIPLLEVSEDLGKRYADQAQATPRELLVRGLERLGQVDVQYKNSKEPRLLVELALIQLSRLSGVDAAEAPTATEAQKKSPDVTSGAPASAPSSPAQATEVRAAAPVPGRTEPLAPTPAAPAAPVPPLAPPAPTRRYAGGVSIKEQLERKSAFPEPVSTPLTDAPGTEPGGSTKEVNLSLLLHSWREYALARKQEGKLSLFATLTHYEPQVEGPGTVSFTIVNDVQEIDLRGEKPALLGHLRRQLGDPNLNLIVNKVQSAKRALFTPRERFDALAERNPALIALRDALDLDLG